MALIAIVLSANFASCSKEDIAVGDTARVKVNFNPKNRPGTFMKLVRVYTNNSNNPYMLSIRGVVKKEEKKSGDE